jgi:hypothetical protein
MLTTNQDFNEDVIFSIPSSGADIDKFSLDDDDNTVLHFHPVDFETLLSMVKVRALVVVSVSGSVALRVPITKSSPLLECDPTVCLPEKSKVTRGETSRRVTLNMEMSRY